MQPWSQCLQEYAEMRAAFAAAHKALAPEGGRVQMFVRIGHGKAAPPAPPPIEVAAERTGAGASVEAGARGGALRIGYAELEGATGGFDAARRLGEGGFGAVYAGTYRHTAVAVKRLERGELAAACGMTTADSLDNEARRHPPASHTLWTA